MATLLRLWFFSSKGGYAFAVFLAVLLADRGFGAAAIARLFVLVTVATMLGSATWSAIADRLGARVQVLRGLEVASVAALAVMLAAGQPAVFVAAAVLWAFCFGGKDPVGDAVTLDALAGRRAGYGDLRAFGEVGFVAAVLAIGLLRPTLPDAPIVAALLLYAAASLAALLMPAARLVPTANHEDDTGSMGVLRRRGLVALLVASVLHGAGLSAQASFFSLRIEGAGLPSWTTGAGLATGALSSIAAMLLARRILERIGAARLFALAVLSAAPRWLLVGLVDEPAALVAVQLLHASSFALAWIAGVVRVAELVPGRDTGAALGLFTASMFGVGSLFAMLGAAVLLPLVGVKGLFCCVALTSAGAAIAAGAGVRRARR